VGIDDTVPYENDVLGDKDQVRDSESDLVGVLVGLVRLAENVSVTDSEPVGVGEIVPIDCVSVGVRSAVRPETERLMVGDSEALVSVRCADHDNVLPDAVSVSDAVSDIETVFEGSWLGVKDSVGVGSDKDNVMVPE
jgi:hypothetical protein